MEENSTPRPDLEKLLREQLEQLDATPDDNSWEGIAARQRGPNIALRLRYWARFIVPAVLLLTVAGIAWYRARPGSSEAPQAPASPAIIAPQQLQPDPAAPVASLNAAGKKEVAIRKESPSIFRPQPRQAVPQMTEVGPARPKSFNLRPNTVPATTLRFKAEEGIRYESPISGTNLSIPANSMVYADGRPVQGEVELFFREYRNVGDFLAFGVPMHYGDSRGDFFFNSGGMVEVRVGQNGQELSMAPGQNFKLELIPTDKLSNPALYYFDETKGAWAFQPDAAFAGQTGALPVPVSEPVVLSDNNDSKSGAECLPDLIEAPEYLLQEGAIVGEKLAAGQLEMPRWFVRNPRLTDQQLLNGLAQGRIHIVKDRDKEEQLFPEDLDNVFTELKAFKDCYFLRRVDTLPSSKIALKLASDRYWDQVYVLEEQGNTCRIILYSRNDKLEFYADLVPSPGVASFSFEKVMAEYRRVRMERQDANLKLAAQMRNFMLAAPLFMTDDEWCMSAVGWIDYFNQNKPMMLERYRKVAATGFTTDPEVTKSMYIEWNKQLVALYSDNFDKSTRGIRQKSVRSLMYSLRLTRFGTYNCDQIYRLSVGGEPVYVDARYKTPDGQAVYPASASVIDPQNRLFFTLPNPEQLLWAEGRKLDVILTGQNGRCYRLSRDNYPEVQKLIRSQNAGTIVVEDVTDQTQTSEAWTRLLSI